MIFEVTYSVFPFGVKKTLKLVSTCLNKLNAFRHPVSGYFYSERQVENSHYELFDVPNEQKFEY